MPDRSTIRGDRLLDRGFLRRLEGLRLRARAINRRHVDTAATGSAVGDGLEFADHRTYAPGDDLRLIDWAAFARTDRMWVRRFHIHSESDVAVLLDTSASMAAGNGRVFDTAVQVAAAMGYLAITGGRAVRLIDLCADDDGGGAMYTFGRNRRLIPSLLERLSATPTGGTWNAAATGRRLAPMLADAGTCIIITDGLELNVPPRRLFAALAGGGRDLVCVHVCQRPAELARPGRSLRLEDAEAHRQLDVDVTDELLDEVDRRWRAHRRALSAALVACGGVYAPVPAETPFERPLLQTLQRQGILTE